jgi:cytochrome o ubiquinol oxidase subunit IV
MSAPTASHDAHDHHDHDAHDDGAPHGSRKSYLVGFLLSVVLTAIPFALVMADVFPDARVTAGLVMAAAVIQIVVHMIFFLHMNTKSENGWTFMALMFTLIIVVICISGSLWVMYNMNANMMPAMGVETTSGGM